MGRMTRRGVLAGAAGAGLAWRPWGHGAAEQAPTGDATIRAPAGRSEIVVTTTRRLAGAIHSLTWGGREFIDSADHGRQLQSAINLDAGGPIQNETYNPTEAGSAADGAGPVSSSRLLALRAEGRQLETTTRMAFWLAPGGRSGGHPAKNTTVLSRFLLSKRVTLGLPGLPQAIDYRVTFTLPEGERHTRAVFEALTAYMPPDFDTFWGLDPAASGGLVRLDAGPGEQPRPIVAATADGAFALGVIAPGGAAAARGPRPCAGPGYGRFVFTRERVSKWNCVFRAHDPSGLPPGRYDFAMVVAVGTRDDVAATLAAVAARGGPR